MQKINNLVTNNKALFTNKQWYHQRFDGCPMFIFPIAEAEPKKEKRKPLGTEGRVRAFFFSPGVLDWYISMEDIKRGSNKIIALAKKDKNISTKLLKAWEKDEKKFAQFFWHEFPKINLKKLSNNELVKLWNKSYQLFVNRVTSSALIDHFALGTDKLINDMLRKEIFSKQKYLSYRQSEFTEIFSTATAPVHQSFINLEEIELLNIATSKSKTTLTEHAQKWFWGKNNYYRSQILGVEHFKKEISAWKKTGKNLAEEAKRIQNTPVLNKTKKHAFFKKHKLSALLKTLIKISEDFTWWQDERKKSTYFNIHIGCEILKEISKRTKYQLNELKYAFPLEIETIPSRKELQKRTKFGAGAVIEGAFEVMTGKKAKDFKKTILGDTPLKDINDFRGLSASTGKAVGRVRIVKSVMEVNKVKAGEILVAVMTRPDYLMGMKKAAAIVTNEGGITSHAAIVSRELGIPCIIGTKIATEVLKDGDLVEVNANRGVVKKLD